ncbi:MAG: hypothetical protein WB507_12890 [Solirubrobacterales bacterium]
MIVSVHLATVGWRTTPLVLRESPEPASIPGLRYAETVITALLGDRLLPAPQPGRVGLIAAWEDDGAVEEFSRRHPLARRFADGWNVRMEPLRVSGFWSGMPDLPSQERATDDGEPVAVLTLGRLRLGRGAPFLQSAAPAEGEVLTHPGLLASTGLARPPRLLSTFSLWRSAAEMRDYAYRKQGAHQAAVRADRARPFHHESAFIRFRPYSSTGSWGGSDPLAAFTGVRQGPPDPIPAGEDQAARVAHGSAQIERLIADQ